MSNRDLNEEIHNILFSDKDDNVKFYDFVRLFRTWALECVGEDDELDETRTDERLGDYANKVGRNQAKQEIRKRIEEIGK